MSRPVLAPLVVALSALFVVPQIQAEPTAPLFVVEQQRSALVSRLAKQWSDAFATLPKERRLDHEQLSSALFALRADRLFAVTLAGDAEAVEAVLADAKREAVQPRVAAKSLGDATADLTYTPINPCRILDTRATPAGPLAANVARTFDGYSTNFATQGGTGSGCGIPNGVAALAINVYAVNPTNLGFIKVWPANAAEPAVSTVNYQVGITAIATGALVPVDSANSNQFSAKSPATVDFIADVVGYFKPPGDATSLDIKVAGQRVMRYQYTPLHNYFLSPDMIGGHSVNYVDTSNSPIGRVGQGAVIGGGGAIGTGFFQNFWICHGSCANSVTDMFGTIGGGAGNQAGRDPPGSGLSATFAVIGGGLGNRSSGEQSTVGGGEFNVASAVKSTVAGGLANRADNWYAMVGGGYANLATGQSSTIAGGDRNRAGGSYSTVPGGSSNTASGVGSLAAGNRAKTQTADATPIVHDGVFVFADRSDFDFRSTANNEFAVRASGGVRFVTAIDGTGMPTWTCGVSGGAGGSWGCTSDRDAKTDLIPLDGGATLERLAALPVYQWTAKDDPRRTPHAGPTAQDFMAAFGLGDNDKMIGFADAQGVAFAAIKGLDQKIDKRAAMLHDEARARQDEIALLKQELTELRRALDDVLRRVPSHGNPTALH